MNSASTIQWDLAVRVWYIACMRNNTYTAIYKKVRGGYTAWIEEVTGVISEGRTKKEVENNLKDALALMLETNRIMSHKDATGEIERSSISVPASA